MSDSLNATVIEIVPVFTISANGVLELEDDPEPPRLPAVAEPPAAPAPPPVPVPVDELEVELELVAFDVDPAETESPGRRLSSEAIVPLVGAYSFVSFNACWAFWTLASAP
jgi:hypothetical protein